MNRTRSKQPLPWYKTLKQYYYRPQWEFYDIRSDPEELKNLHGKYILLSLLLLFYFSGFLPVISGALSGVVSSNIYYFFLYTFLYSTFVNLYFIILISFYFHPFQRYHSVHVKQCSRKNAVKKARLRKTRTKNMILRS